MINKKNIIKHLSNFVDPTLINFYDIENINLFLEEVCNNLCISYENFLYILKDLRAKKIDPKDTIILHEYAGFGDTIHTKLIIQHLQKQYKNIVWITLDEITKLYKEEKEILIYSNKFFNKLRNPHIKFNVHFSLTMEYFFKKVFVDYKNIDISKNIVFSHLNNFNLRFHEHYYKIFNLQRDLELKHKITHTDKIKLNNNKPIIAFEHISISFKNLENLTKYQNIVNILKKDYDIVLLGNKNDPYIDGVFLDFRGRSFYDTISLLKDTSFFIGRNSANQTLTVFFQDLPVFEIDTPQFSTLKSMSYKNNIYNVNNISDIVSLIGKLK